MPFIKYIVYGNGADIPAVAVAMAYRVDPRECMLLDSNFDLHRRLLGRDLGRYIELFIQYDGDYDLEKATRNQPRKGIYHSGGDVFYSEGGEISQRKITSYDPRI